MGKYFEISVGVDRSQATSISRALYRIPPAVRQMLNKRLTDGLRYARAWMIENYLSGGPMTGRTTSRRLAMRSGNLVRSIRTKTTVTGREIEGRMWIDRRTRAARYGPAHEYGATIKPKRSQYLTIPLREELRGRPARSIPGLFFVRSKKGNLFLARRKLNRQSGFVPMYLLVKEVTLPARPFFQPTADKVFPSILADVDRELAKVLEERGE